MRRGILVTALVLATTSGCARLADSPVNPLNWFGGGGAQQVAADPAERRPLVPETRGTVVVDQRVPVQRITALSIDRTPYGALVTATGRADSPGYFNADLVPVSTKGGALTLEMRAEAPPAFEAAGTDASRRITVGYTLSPEQLAGLARVRVTGAENSRSARP